MFIYQIGFLFIILYHFSKIFIIGQRLLTFRCGLSFPYLNYCFLIINYCQDLIMKNVAFLAKTHKKHSLLFNLFMKIVYTL